MKIAGLNGVGRDLYGVFPLRGNLLNVREASSKQILENKDIQNIMKILGLELNKEYTNVKSLRYGHLMIMADRVCFKSLNFAFVFSSQNLGNSIRQTILYGIADCWDYK